ncbi:hypothetical protein [Sphingomonas immobilis]|uniref:Uncharacterized protein n=1 Tax=Sphingomonas immobilis TaxID=3063997 RepID=A0ABT8ZV67_9SPHN|nr:hypothetical protein [Sphingomonas sp. CA1-15]MDO7841112.1 hypothetical protein [Sphingomonas sp. CA1-15]
MRQPDRIQITPSASQPWYGWCDEGQRFTRAQLHGMKHRGIDPETVEAITVKRSATSREMWWPTNQAAPVFEFDCPVMSRRRDGRLNIMAPSGEIKPVEADGWVKRPKARPAWKGF